MFSLGCGPVALPICLRDGTTPVPPPASTSAWHNQSSGATNTFAQDNPSGTDLSAGKSYFGPIAGINVIGNPSEDESIVTFPFGAGTFRKASTIVCQKSSPDASRWRLRVNGADSAIVVQIPTATYPVSSAAIFSDPTNTVAVSEGDTAAWELEIDPTTTIQPGVVNPAVGIVFDGSGGTRKTVTCHAPTAVNYSTSADRFMTLTGANNQVAGDCGIPFPQAATLDRAAMRLTVAGSGAKAARIAINGAAQTGAGSIAVPLTATGLVSDPTNTQAVTKGQTVSWVLQGSGTTPSILAGSLRITSDIAGRVPMLSQAPSSIAGNSSEAFFNFDHGLRRNNVEGESRSAVPVAGAMQDLFVRVETNTSGTGTTVNLRRLAAGAGGGSGTDTALGIVIPPNAGAAIYSDPTNTVALAEGDAICWRLPATYTSAIRLNGIAASFQVTA